METKTAPVQIDTELNWIVPESDPKLERRKELQDRALNKLQNFGLIQRTEKDGEEILVINNPDFFLSGKGKVTIDGQEVEKSLDQVVESCASSILAEVGKNNAKALFYIFENKKGVILGQEEQNPRDIIYIPQNAKSAFDLEKIRENKDKFIFLYSSLSKSWLSDHPTKDNEFNDHLTVFEVDMAMMIYGQSDGLRDGSNNLTVLNSNGERQQISGKWFKDNFGFHNIGDRNWGNPTSILDKYGGKLTESGLLTNEDFTHRSLGNNTIKKDGTYYIEGKKFGLGRGNAGKQIIKLDSSKYAVCSNDGEQLKVDFVFEPSIKEEMKKLVRVQSLGSKGKTFLYVPNGVYPKEDRENMTPTVLTVFNKDSRKQVVLDSGVVFDKLIAFQKEFETNQEMAENWNNLALEEKISISETFSSLNDENKKKCFEFTSRFGESGLKAISEGYLQGGFDQRLLGLLDLENGAVEIMNSYLEVINSANKLEVTINNSLGNNTKSKEIDTFNVFNSRIIEAMKIRSKDVLLSALTDTSQESTEQMEILTELIESVNESTKNTGEMHPQSDKPAIFENSRVTQVFTGSNKFEGQKLVVTVRPTESKDTGQKGKGQARIQFRYINNKGKELNMRIDSDEFGTSLDLGARGQPMVEVLKSVSGTHHTQVNFENQFSDPRTFARMAKIFAGVFNMNSWS